MWPWGEVAPEKGGRSLKLEVLEKKKKFWKPEAVGWLRVAELGEERWECSKDVNEQREGPGGQGQGEGRMAQRGRNTLRVWNIRHPFELMLPADFLLQNYALFKLNCMKLPLFIAPKTQISALSYQQSKQIVAHIFIN